MKDDVVILGGGLAGTSAGIQLARAGCKVLLIEKELRPHHKVCGEFLSREALVSLRALDIDLAALGAVPLHAVRLATRGHTSAAPLPFPALSLTRRALDEALLRQAENSGVTVQRGRRVQALDSTAHGYRVQLDDATTIAASTVFLASGKHDLSGHARPAGRQRNLVAFKMYFALAPAQAEELAGHVELLLYPGGYGGMQPVEESAANLCCLIDRAELQRLGGGWQNFLAHMQRHCPQLARRLAGAMPLLVKPLAISSIPYGFVREHTTPNLWQLGDQAAVIPSFTGDGMSIALHSASLAASRYIAGASAQDYQQQLHAQLKQQVALATAISRGLVFPLTRTLLTTLAKMWPSTLGLIAQQTRIREEATQHIPATA